MARRNCSRCAKDIVDTDFFGDSQNHFFGLVIMRQLRLISAIGIVICAGLLAPLSWSNARAQNASGVKPDEYDANNRQPDPRFKADILVVVAHPDDEGMVTAYLAREIYDHKKRVAVVWATHGEGSINDVGPEQSTAMGDIRGIEGREAV